MEKELPDIQATFAFLNHYLKKDESHRIIHRNLHQSLVLIIKFMREQISNAENNETITPDKEQIVSVKDSLQQLIHTIVLETADREFLQFMDYYILLCFNWNQQLGQSCAVDRSIKALERLLEYQSSMTGAAEMLRYLIKETQALANFTPPAFKISQGYLSAIDERLKCKDC